MSICIQASRIGLYQYLCVLKVHEGESGYASTNLRARWVSKICEGGDPPYIFVFNVCAEGEGAGVCQYLYSRFVRV